MYVAWARVLGHDFDRLVRETAGNHRTLIDGYGATNPAELFAVATDAFFEKPRRLQSKHPALYLQLQQFHRKDPPALGEASVANQSHNVGLIRFRGHFPKGGYDVHNGSKHRERPAVAAAVQ